MLKVQYVRTSVPKIWKHNPRDNERAVKAVAESIRRFGFNVPILCDRKMQVISGHARLKAAKQLGMRTVPVIVLGMAKKERWSFSVIENKTAELAEWDMPRLASVVRELRSADTDLSCLGFSKAELDALLHPEEPFNWGQAEANEQQRAVQTNALIPVKVRASRRQAVKKATSSTPRENAYARETSRSQPAEYSWTYWVSGNEQALGAENKADDTPTARDLEKDRA